MIYLLKCKESFAGIVLINCLTFFLSVSPSIDTTCISNLFVIVLLNCTLRFASIFLAQSSIFLLFSKIACFCLISSTSSILSALPIISSAALRFMATMDLFSRSFKVFKSFSSFLVRYLNLTTFLVIGNV